jgi:CheY-like chemotaxis protein
LKNQHEPKSGKPQHPRSTTRAPGKIYLIDDNRDDNLYHRLVLEEILPDSAVLAFDNGADALAFFTDPANTDSSDAAVAFVDLNMPAMNGWEFIDAFEATPASGHTSVTVLSTTENPSEMRRAREHPLVDSFLAKPLSDQKLRLLATRRADKRRTDRAPRPKSA